MNIHAKLHPLNNHINKLSHLYLEQRNYSHVHQGFSLASAIGHSPKIVPDEMSESFLSNLDSLSETIFGNAGCAVMHSDAIVFLL